MDIEHRGVIEDPVKGAKKGSFLVEIFSPQGRASIAGEDDVVGSLFVVAPVNQIKEQTCVLFIELTMSNLINNETG